MSDVGVAQRAEARHDHAWNAFVRTHAAQHDLDQVGGIRQIQRGVEREIGPVREGNAARIVVTGRAGDGVEPRPRV